MEVVCIEVVQLEHKAPQNCESHVDASRSRQEILECHPYNKGISSSYPIGCAATGPVPCERMKAPKQAQEDTSPAKFDVTSKSPVGGISIVPLIRTNTTLDHSLKAEKV